MAERTASSRTVAGGPSGSSPTGGDQLWPIVCATMVLVGVMGVVIWNYSDFDEQSLVLNGYTHFGALAIGAVLLIFIAARLKGAARRTAELAILISLAWHAAAGLGAFYLFTIPLMPTSLDAGRDASVESDDETLPQDYRWDQDEDEDQQVEQAFEKVVATPVREQAPPAARVKPRDMARPAPAVEVPRAPEIEVTPLGIGSAAEPGRALDIRQPGAVKPKEAQLPDAVAMARQKADELPLPKTDAPVPQAMPAASKEAVKPTEPVEPTAVPGKPDWSAIVQKAAAPNNEPIPSPHKMARVEVQPGEPLPSGNVIARLPSQPLPRTNAPSGAEAADKITQQGSTLERSNRDGLPLPSAVVPDAGLPAQLPPSAGSSPASGLDAVSTVPVEKSDTSRAPLGPTIASAGTQDFGRGSTLFPTRRGIAGGHGKAAPSFGGDSSEDPAELRAGSPGSDLSKGMALTAAPARRAIASQTEDGGSGAAAGLSARLPRTQSDMAWDLPTAAKIVDRASVSGAGGVGSRPGGATSTLQVGPSIALRRYAGNGTGDSSPHGTGSDPSGLPGGSGANNGPGEVLLGSDAGLAGNAVAAVGGGNGGPRRIESGTPGIDDNGTGNIPRARSDGFVPRPTAMAAGPVNGTAAVSTGATPGGTSQGYGAAPLGPNSGLGGIARREDAGAGIGSRPAGQVEPSDIAAPIGRLAPLGGAVGRGGRSDAQLDQVLAGSGTGVGGGRVDLPVVVSGRVHEPMESFRRGAVHGGLGIGDSTAGQLTEPAIENGLEYLSHTQFGDGHWSLHEPPPGAADEASLGSLHADTAATGLALLSYLGAGYTHEDEKYRDVVRRGVEWLVKHQQPDGDLSYHGTDPAYDPKNDPTRYYSHGIATIALCEAYGMTQDRELRAAAQKAVDFIVTSQDPLRGGWRYEPQAGSDTSVTGWQLIALKSAQMAGLDVPEGTLRKVDHWLDLAEVPNRGTYVYNPWNTDRENPQGRAPNATMTAQAMIMRLYLGRGRDNAALAQGADYLLAHMPDAASPDSGQDCYFWYYATQAMYHMQGDFWKAWDARVTPLLRAQQVDRGPLKGSWSPSEPVPDRWRSHGGRHYVTTMHILTLEFRYWHLPLFRELRKE